MSPERPTLTVVVDGRPLADRLDRTLRSLSTQTLARDRYEVVIVANALLDLSESAITVRQLVVPVISAPRARNAGMQMARGDYVTFVDAGDTVSSGYLDALLAIASPGAVGVAHVAEPNDRGSGLDFGPRSRLASTLRREPTASALSTALAAAPGKVLPAAFGRVVGFEAEPDSGGDTMFFWRLATRFDLEYRFCRPSANAFYYRSPVSRSTPTEAPNDDDAAVERDLDVIGQLTSAVAAPMHRLVLEAAIGTRVDSLNRTLRRSPHLHAPILAGVRSLGLASFDYERLNRGVARDLAILYAALPFADTSANIAARRVRAAGRLVDVVSADLSGRRPVDHSAAALWAEWLGELHQIPGPATMDGEWGPTAQFCTRGLLVVEGAERAKGAYRSLYSRTMFPGSHLLAALVKIRHPDIPWLAEFSDPQLRNSRGELRMSKGEPDRELLAELADGVRARGFEPPASDNVWEWAENVAYALADSVLFTNDHQRAYMLGYCADRAVAARAAAHSLVERHPAPPTELYHAADAGYDLDPALTHVGYFGTFYPTRSLTEVVAALKGLEPDARARLRLHVFTKNPKSLRAEAADAGLGDVLVVNAYLGFLDYLNMTTRVDVLLVNDYHTVGRHEVNPYLPAKYADYVGSGRPIWGIVEPGSVLSSLPLDYRSELGDVAGARRILTQLSALHRLSPRSTGPDDQLAGRTK